MLNIQAGTLPICHKYLDSMGKINQQSVQGLPQEIKIFLQKVTPVRLKELAQMNCFAATKIKTELDKQYGKNNYVLIAIGRSISSIAELMGNMGVNIKIVPLSGLRRREPDKIPIKNLQTYKTFLVQQELSKTDLKNNKEKTYILMDYTYYGRTLEKAERLFKRNELLGDVPNLISMPVSKALGEDYEKRGFKKLFEYCRFKDYSYVGKLHVDNLNDVYKQCSPDRVKIFQGNITQMMRKLFWFNVFNSLKEQNYKNILPLEELNAIYNHHLSPKAINNYIKREFEKQQKVMQFITNLK